MKQSLFFLACSLGALGYKTQGNVLKLGQDDFSEALKEYPNMLVKFFAPWCGHCKTLAPTYLEAADALNQDGSLVKLAEVDCTVHRPLCQKYDVKGYPTVHFFSEGNQQPTKYTNPRTKQAIINFVNQKVPLPVKEQQKQAPQYERQGNLYKLTLQTFQTARNTFDFLFVKFYAPWCGHCKNMAETWVKFADSISNDKVAIAQVDCTQHSVLCGNNGVRGYPTLKLFVRGNEVVDFKQARTLQSFTQFLQENQRKFIPGAIPDQKVEAPATEQL